MGELLPAPLVHRTVQEASLLSFQKIQMMKSSEEGEDKFKPDLHQTAAEDDPSAPPHAELLCISWTKLTLHGKWTGKTYFSVP